MLGVARVQILETNLDDMHSSREEDVKLCFASFNGQFHLFSLSQCYVRESFQSRSWLLFLSRLCYLSPLLLDSLSEDRLWSFINSLCPWKIDYHIFGLGNCSPELLHVDGRYTCSDQKGWIKRSERERENIQSNLKGGFLGLECGAQSYCKLQALYNLCFPKHRASSQGGSLLFILMQISANSKPNANCKFGCQRSLQIQILHQTVNSDVIGVYEFESYIKLQIRTVKADCEFER
ncbi:hypothetical protein Tco_0204328 [Tanacetum coccineum]